MKPFFTIVTPSYNQGQYITRTIESIWSQAGNFAIEHIIADGGSTDQTAEIIHKSEHKLKSGKARINCRDLSLRWWIHTDHGQADAINQGFKKARGEILAWLNSDDFYEPETLQRVADYFLAHPEVDCLYGDLNFVDQDGNNPRGCNYVSDFKIAKLLKYCYIPQPATFFRRRVFTQLGPMNTEYSYAFDYDFWLRLARAGLRIEYAPTGVLANLRTYPSRKTESGLIPMRREVIRLMRSHGYWYAPAIFESYYLILKELLMTRSHSRAIISSR